MIGGTKDSNEEQPMLQRAVVAASARVIIWWSEHVLALARTQPPGRALELTHELARVVDVLRALRASVH